MWIILGFLSLGFLVGNIVGMTVSSVITSLLGLLFAFAGGSVLSIMPKLDVADRAAAGKAIMALSMGCVLGIYSGIIVSEHRLLSPRVSPNTNQAQITQVNAQAIPGSQLQDSKQGAQKKDGLIPSAANKYLLSLPVKEITEIDQLRASGTITSDEAYNRLYHLIVNDVLAKSHEN